MKKSICLLLIAVLASSLVGLSRANFFPPPTSLPHVYIRSDGSLEPASATVQRIENIYILTGNLTNRTLEVQCNNVVVDGAGYSLEGNGSGQGIVLKDVTGVIVKNLVVLKLREGIDVISSLNCTIIATTITDTEVGIYLYNSSNNIIENNVIEENSGDAIAFFNGCNHNSIVENQITQNVNSGIILQAPNTMLNQTTCDYNSIIGNNITQNAAYGLWIISSSGCLIQRNTIDNSRRGLQLQGFTCQNNTVIWNRISSCTSYGLILAGTGNNTIAKNTLIWDGVGIDISSSENNQFYNNNFINIYGQVNNHNVDASNLTGVSSTSSSRNSWDNGLASGGNYWCDLNRKDFNNDGYSDQPYVIDANNKDHYPLMQTFGLVEGYTAPSPAPNESPIPSASESQSVPTFDPHSTTTSPVEVAYVLVAVIAIVAVGVAIMLRKRKSHSETA